MNTLALRFLVLVIALMLALAGCDRPADKTARPDFVSGASQPVGAGADRITFVSAGMHLYLEEIVSTGHVIWAMDFIGPDTMIFTERQGAVRLLALHTGKLSELSGGPAVMATDSGGLFDVLVDPNFSNNQFIYFTYVKGLGDPGGRSTVAVARSRKHGDTLTNTVDFFVANNPSADHAHWGSRIVMDSNRRLFFSSGDRHVADDAQRLSSHGGKVLRIDAEGTVPNDNPFVGQPDAMPEIWSYGHRNPQGLAIQPGTGLLFEQEHGPTGGDEINIIKKGNNYGWPVITYGKDIWGGQLPEGTEKAGMEQPLRYFNPGIAPSGIAFYAGNTLPGWQGSVFSSTLRGYVVRLELDRGVVTAEERLLSAWGERIRDVAEGPDGNLYLATESGKIARVVRVKE